jgi:hypothetical protein
MRKTALASKRLASVMTAGRFRLTFRYRDQVLRLIVTTVGEVVSDDSFWAMGLIGVSS